MDRIRAQAVSQLTLEEDFNVPEHKEDIGTLVFENGTILIDEIRPGTDCVHIRGRLLWEILYQTGEGNGGPACMQGKMAFAEKVNIRNIRSVDNVMAEGNLEDLSIHMINSRKLNVQAVLNLQVYGRL